MDGSSKKSDTSDAHVFEDGTCRLILIGKTGSGKSATANTIIGQNCFKEMGGLNSHTKKGGFNFINKDNLTIEVMDTPGLADSHDDNAILVEEIKKSVFAMHPGPHALLLVLRGKARFTNEEFKIRRCANLNTVLNEANWRYVLFDNKADENEKRRQVDKLLGKVESLVVTNQSSYFRHNFSVNLCVYFGEMVNDEIKLLRKKMLITSSDASTLQVKQTQETNEPNKHHTVSDLVHRFDKLKPKPLPERNFGGPRTGKMDTTDGNKNALESESDDKKCENLSRANKPTEQASVEVDNGLHSQSVIVLKDKIVNQPEIMTETQRHEYRRSLRELPDKVKEGFEKENVKDIEQCTVM